MSAPTPLRVRLPFRSEDEFVAQYGAHVGRDGFFLATRAPKPVGTPLLFDLVLVDGSSLLRGEGVVVRSSAAGERPGMTLRFVRLESAGQALVERILAARRARTPAPAEARADLSAWAPPAGPSATPATPPREAQPRPAGPEAWAAPGASGSPGADEPRALGRTAAPPEPRTESDAPSPARAEPAGAPPGSEPTAVEAEVQAEVPDTSTGTTAPPATESAAPTPQGPSAAARTEVSDTSAPELTTAALPTAVSPPVPLPPGTSAPTGMSTTEVSATEVSGTSAAGTSAAAAAEEVSGTSAPGTSAAAAAEVSGTSAAGTSAAAAAEVSGTSAAGTSAAAAAEVSGTSAPGGTDAPRGKALPAGSSTRAPGPEDAPTPLVPTESVGPLPPDVRGSGRPAAAETPGAAPQPMAHPPLDDSELPELVVTEFKGPGPLRPAGLEHTRASADVHAAITPPAGTLVVTELDEPPPEPRFQLDAPVRGDEPLTLPESSFHDVAQALALVAPGERPPLTPIPLLPSMETREEVPVPPPPPLDVAPVAEEGALRLEPGIDLPPTRAGDGGVSGTLSRRNDFPGPATDADRLDAPSPAEGPPAGASTASAPPGAEKDTTASSVRDAASTPPPSTPAAPTSPDPTASATSPALEPLPGRPATPTGPAAPEPAAEAKESSAPAAPAEARPGGTLPANAPGPAPAHTPVRVVPVGTTELGIDLSPESVRVAWFHDGRAELLMLDPEHGRPDARVRLVREPGAAPRMLAPAEPDPALWTGAPLPFLGTRADADVARTLARRWPAMLVPDDRGEAAFALESGSVGATELVATLLRWVRHRVEELTSHGAGRVVLTVPVSFNALQRERLREAAERAGLEGVRLVQAPTAAAMAFAHGRGLARRRILVWRMGESTCDVAVLAASGDDLEMVACAGDASLGSINFDEQIALALDKGARGDAAVLRKRVSEAARLLAQLEDASLSEASVDEGARLGRAELEARTTALVERGVLLAREVLRSASLTPEALDELVLVGGATRLPHVRRMLEEALGRPARSDVQVSAAVATGAATLAHLLLSSGPKSASRTALNEVIGVPLEVVAPELGQLRVLDRGTRLPAEKSVTVTLGFGAPLEIQVFQGPGRAPDPRSFLGLLRATADRAGDWTLHLALDTDGVLRASATNPSGKRQALQLQMPEPSGEEETPPPVRTPSEPEAPAATAQQDTGLFGGLKRLFGRR